VSTIQWVPIAVECVAFAALLLYSLHSARRAWHVLLGALVLTLVATAALGAMSSWFGAWSTESAIALSITGYVLLGTPLLTAAAAIVGIRIIVHSRALISLAAFSAGALAVIPALFVVHSMACGWVGECI